MDFIRTANSDKRSDPEDEEFLCFTLTAPSTVYVLYDSRATDGMEPGWLTRDFADEHLEVAEVDDASMGTMELHFADKPAGRVCIGGNNADGVGSNYMVAVGPVVDHSDHVRQDAGLAAGGDSTLVTNVEAHSSECSYDVALMTAGETMYCDRDYVFLSLPDFLVRATAAPRLRDLADIRPLPIGRRGLHPHRQQRQAIRSRG